MTAQYWTLVGVVVGALLATLGQLVTASVQAKHQQRQRVHEMRLDLYSRCFRALRDYLNVAERYVADPTPARRESVLDRYRELRHLEVDLALVGDRFVSSRLTMYANSTLSLYDERLEDIESWSAESRAAYREHVAELTTSLRSYMRVMRVDLGTAPRLRVILFPGLNKRFVASRFEIPDEPATETV